MALRSQENQADAVTKQKAVIKAFRFHFHENQCAAKMWQMKTQVLFCRTKMKTVTAQCKSCSDSASAWHGGSRLAKLENSVIFFVRRKVAPWFPLVLLSVW